MPASTHFHHVLIIMTSLIFLSIVSANVNEAKGVAVPMQMMMNKSSRRKLEPFRICSTCTCCDGDKEACFPSPCCYIIKCNIPHKPFGYCAFAPTSCNCFGCHP